MANVLNVSHYRQITDGYCLAACVQMALAYLGLEIAQKTLARRLGVRPHIGAPSSRLMRLRSATLDVIYTTGDLSNLVAWLGKQLPILVFVQADQLPHWHGQHFQHAVLVIGSDSQSVYLLDPASAAEPITVSHGDFLLAWDERDYVYAVIHKHKNTNLNTIPDL